MKRWIDNGNHCLGIIAGAAVVAVLCISVTMIKGRPDSGEIGYSVVAEDGSDAGNVGSISAGGKEKEGDGADSGKKNTGLGDTDSGEDDSLGKPKKARLTDQIQEHGSLSKRAKKTLLDAFVSGKSVVILDCQRVQAPAKMKIYRKKEVELRSENTKRKLEALLCEAVKDNPNHTSYRPVWLSDDYYERTDGDSEDSFSGSIEQPYRAVTPTGTSGFLLMKGIYDTRVRTEDRFFLTQKRAVRKTKKFLNKMISELDLGCEVSSAKTWEILGLTLEKKEQETGLIMPYENGISEDYYKITAYCALDGYPVVGDIGEESMKAQGSDCFTMFYSESGWLHMNCEVPHAYRDTGTYFDRILSLKDIQRKLQEALKKESGAASYGVSEAQLGYAATEKKLRPAWILYGEKKCAGGGEGRYILDAVTGEVLAWQMDLG